MTLEKYFDKLQVVEASNGSKEVVQTKQFLSRDKPKLVCLWLIHEPGPRVGCEYEKDGFCTNEKYCNQKGRQSR